MKRIAFHIVAFILAVSAGLALADFTFKDSTGTTQTSSLVSDGANATVGAKADAAWVSGSGSVIAILKNIANGIAASLPAGTNTIGNVNGAPNVTANDCSGSISVGGTAQNAFAAQTTLHGFTIANVDSAHGDEVLWISFTTTAAAQTAASYPLPPPTATSFANFGSFTTPTGFGLNHAVSIVGATTGHVFSCTWW